MAESTSQLPKQDLDTLVSVFHEDSERKANVDVLQRTSGR